MGIPHFLVIPYPGQGHVNPIMQLSHALVKHGCKVTFLSTEFSHKRMKAASSGQETLLRSQITPVSLPDGLDPEDDRNDLPKLLSSIKNTMPSKLLKLIEEINALDGGENKIACIVVTVNMGWALKIGHKLGIKGALLWPSSATSLGFCGSIQRLIDEGVIDSQYGLPIKNQEIKLSPSMPVMDPANLPWCSLGKEVFEHLVQEMQTLNLAGWWLCNTIYELELEAFSLSPKLSPIGPLLESDSNPISFWQEDRTCLEWLDQQPSQSVIYVSFGSLAVMEPNQFRELALGLDLLNKPFLWVVRQGNDHNKVNHAYPDEFRGTKGKIIDWAPQKMILNHPATACFISHCGWNSTIEGLYGGVPFLCWPFFSDQCMNQSLICDQWKIGLRFDKDENGVTTRGEIKKKVEHVLCNEDMKARSSKLKEIVTKYLEGGGRSLENLKKFIHWAKE